MISDSNIKRIRRGIGQTERLQLILHPSAEDTEVSSQLAELCDKMEVVSGGTITIVQGDGANLLALPALTLSDGERRNIHYLALPEGPETEPFVEVLSKLGETTMEPEEPWAAQLTRLKRPAELVVFIGLMCPHCPQVVRSALRLALASAQITTVIIDVMLFPKLAEQYAIRSVPLTLIDRELGVVGVKTAAELAEMVIARDEEDYGVRVFVSLVEQGRHDEAAKRLLGDPMLLVTPWRKSTTSTRMGLMLVVEEVLDEERSALDGAVPSLIEVLQSEDGSLRGDTADLLGQIGHQGAIPDLEELRNDPNPDVAEIAAEALEEIEARMKQGS